MKSIKMIPIKPSRFNELFDYIKTRIIAEIEQNIKEIKKYKEKVNKFKINLFNSPFFDDELYHKNISHIDTLTKIEILNQNQKNFNEALYNSKYNMIYEIKHYKCDLFDEYIRVYNPEYVLQNPKILMGHSKTTIRYFKYFSLIELLQLKNDICLFNTTSWNLSEYSLNLTLDFIEDNMDFNWNFQALLWYNEYFKKYVKWEIKNDTIIYHYDPILKTKKKILDELDKVILDESMWHFNILGSFPNFTINVFMKYKHYIEDDESIKIIYNNPSINKNELLKMVDDIMVCHLSEVVVISDIVNFPTLDWSWETISKSDKIQMKDIEKYPELPWNWSFISANPNITIDFIAKNIEKPFDWKKLSKHKSISMDDIRNNLNFPWDYESLSLHPFLTMDFILENKDKPWDLSQIMGNKYSYEPIVYNLSIKQLIHMSEFIICSLTSIIEKYVEDENDQDDDV